VILSGTGVTQLAAIFARSSFSLRTAFVLGALQLLCGVLYSAPPVITSIRPNTVVAGMTFRLDIEGSGFAAVSTELRTGPNLSVTSVRVTDSTHIQAMVVAGASGLSTIQVQVSSEFSASSTLMISPSPLDVTSSLASTFLAGRTANTNSPDGVGAGAYLDQPRWVTGCQGKLYFVDLRGLRSVDLLTARVTTLIPGVSSFQTFSCDGNSLYTSSTASGGQLTIQRIDPNTLQTSTFSYPAIGSYTLGIPEYGFVIGGVLYTTDSASGRIWKIDLATHDRSLVVNFGGPMFTSSGSSRPPTLNSVGAFWTDGVDIYVVRPQPAPPFQSLPAVLTRIRIDTGETTPLLTGYFGSIWGLGSTLYFIESQQIQKLDLQTGQKSSFIAFTGSITWSDGQSLYFSTLGFGNGAVGKIDLATGQVSIIAGDLLRDADGSGADARFSIYNGVPGIWAVHGDSRYLYISEGASLRRFDLSSGVLSTLASGFDSSGSGLWTDGVFAYLRDQYAIRRIDLTTGQTEIIAGSLTERGNGDGVGTAARFGYAPFGGFWGDGANLYVSDNPGIRKVNLATGAVTTLVSSSPGRCIWGMGRDLYICDMHAVLKLNLDTLAMETIAGSGVEGSDDGIGLDARFQRVDGIWGDGASLFVTDAMRRIRRIVLASRRVATIYNSAQLTSVGVFGDGSHLYFLEGFSLRRYDPETSVLTFATPGQGLYVADFGAASSSPNIVHSEIRFSPGTATAGATAILSYRNPEGVLVSETAVPAQPALQRGRIYAEVDGPVNTGVAISNPNDSDVRIDFYFTGLNGVDSHSGSFQLRSHEQSARFLNEAPFSGGEVIHGAFTFTASAPVAAIALRGRTNERSEFLMTTLPVVDLDAPVSNQVQTMAHFSTGGGWRTEILLVNPTDETLSGTVRFIGDDGVAGASYPYTISPRSSQRLTIDDSSRSVQKGSVSITPQANAVAPVPLIVFGYTPSGITVTETGVPATQGVEFAEYVESTGPMPDEINSGIAVANTTDQDVTVSLRLATAEGFPFGQSTVLRISPRAQVSKFLPELFPALTLPFHGVLHISSTSNISVIGLRGRYNSRHEFLLSTVTPLNKATLLSDTPLYLPHLITGGGYSTRLFFINPTGNWSAGTIRLYKADGNPASN
jgi:hypothetical protein